jgi:hypothetical protein
MRGPAPISALAFFVCRISSRTATGVIPCIRFAAAKVLGLALLKSCFASIDNPCILLDQCLSQDELLEIIQIIGQNKFFIFQHPSRFCSLTVDARCIMTCNQQQTLVVTTFPSDTLANVCWNLLKFWDYRYKIFHVDLC